MKKVFDSLVLMALVAVFMNMAFEVPVHYTVLALLGVGFIIGLLKLEYQYPGILFDGFVILDTTYAGEAASTFIVKAITGNETCLLYTSPSPRDGLLSRMP